MSPAAPDHAARYHLRRPVALVGMMGSGKSAVGRALSGLLGVPLRDSDHEIERAANATIAEVFARDGEPFFRDREAEVIARLMTGAPMILSTGGGAYLAERTRSMISQHGVALWLDADLDLLWERVRHKDTRPLLRTENPYQTLADLYGARVPVYRLADLSVRTRPEYSVQDTAMRVIDTLSQHPEILEISHEEPR